MKPRAYDNKTVNIMGIFGSLVLTLVLLWPHSFVDTQTIIEHPPILEGASTTLTCSGTTQSNERIIYWTDKLTNSVISTCYLLNSTCENAKSGKYKARMNFGNGMYNSSLSIEKITSGEQNTTFECSISGFSKNSNIHLQTWKLSRVFYGPDQVTCTAHKDGAVLNVTCSTPKVYPGILCEMFQIYNEQLTIVVSSIVYVNGFTSLKRYNPASCSAIIPIHLPGIYHYHVTVYAGVNYSDRRSSGLQQYETNRVTVIPSIVNEQKTKNVCPGTNSSVLFWCRAYAMPTPPTFKWHFSKIREEDVTMESTYHSGNFYRSVIELRNLTSSEDIIATCKVEYTEGNITKSLTNKTKVDLLRLPHLQTPFFSHKGKYVTRMFDVSNGDTTGTFVCEYKGGRSDQTSIHVMCNASDQQVVLTDSSTDSNSLIFTLNYIKAKYQGFCECSVQHQCNSSKAHFKFFLASPQPLRQVEVASTSYIIYYIIAGTIGVIFLIVILGTLMFLCNRWRELYSYIYFYFSITGSVGRRTLDRDFPHTYEPIGGFFSRRSNRRPCWAQEFENTSGTTGSDLTNSRRNIYPVGEYINTAFCSKGNPHNHGNGFDANTHGCSEMTHLQPNVNQSGIFRKVLLCNEQTVTPNRPLHKQPCSVSSHSDNNLQIPHHQASYNPNNSALDESSSLNHYHAPPPIPCRILVSNNESLTPLQTLFTNSTNDGKPQSDNDYQQKVSQEISKSGESLSSRNLLPLPPHPCFRRINTNDDVFFSPISRPSKEMVYPQMNSSNTDIMMDEIDLIYETLSLQSFRLSLLSTGESPDEDSFGCEDNFPDLIPLKNRSRIGAETSTHSLQRVPGTSLMYNTNVRDFKKCKRQKKYGSRSADSNNLRLKPRVSLKSTMHGARADRFQREKSRIPSRVLRCGTSVDHNVQPAPPIPHKSYLLSMEKKGMMKPSVIPRKTLWSSVDDVYLEPIPKLPPRQPIARSASDTSV